MKFIAVWDEGDQTEITDEVQQFLTTRPDSHVAQLALWQRLTNLVEEERLHKANRDYGEAHGGDFGHFSGGGDVRPVSP